VRVRLTNVSSETWQFEPGSSAGVHCAFMVTDTAGTCHAKGRGGLLRADVSPGQSIAVTLPMPSLPAGTYYLFVDMQDEAQQSYFYQHGSEPLLKEVVIGP
jgi:hypothetical protein